MGRGKAASTNESILGKSEFKVDRKLGHSPLAQPPRCPECASQKVWKDGLRYTKQGEIQRWLCRLCGFRFSDPSHSKVEINITSKLGETSKPKHDLRNIKPRNVLSSKQTLNNPSLARGEDVASHVSTSPMSTVGKVLNTFYPNNRNCRVCETDGVLKNLVKVETRLKQAAGATKVDKATVKGKIVEFVWHLKKQGYSPETIKTYTANLKRLLKYGANLLDGESVKEIIAQQETWNTTTKHVAVTSYTAFANFNGSAWNPPSYKPQTKLPFIPLESEIDALTASSGKKTATILQLLKETAMRIGEACRLRWIDVDLEHNAITVNNPEKHGKPRMFKISSKLAAMLNALPRINERVLGKTRASDAAKTLARQRKRVALKLQNPRINYIHFHTLRHWKATMEYHKTKDILHVKEMLGHRSIDNTLIYTQLINFESDEFHVRVAKTLEEDKDLIEAGFEYVTERDGVKVYRKRK